MNSIKQSLKRWFLGDGRGPRRIRSGPFQGLLLEIDCEDCAQIILGLSERETYAALRRLSQGIRSGVDVGAGAHAEHTLFFLRQKTVERVLSFEPNPGYLEGFARNRRLNGFEFDPRLTRCSKCVTNSDSNSSSTLDSWIFELLQPCLIKVDVDGGEVDVLRGASAMLKSARVRWLLETHSAELENQCSQILRANGYLIETINPAIWRRWLPEHRTIPFNRWLTAARPKDVALAGNR
jgi:hypothetical protein